MDPDRDAAVAQAEEMEFLLWSEQSDQSKPENIPRAVEILFEVFTQPAQPARQIRINNVWSNRVRTQIEQSPQSFPMQQTRQTIDYADICQPNCQESVIRRVIQPNNSSNFQVQCLNVDSN